MEIMGLVHFLIVLKFEKFLCDKIFDFFNLPGMEVESPQGRSPQGTG